MRNEMNNNTERFESTGFLPPCVMFNNHGELLLRKSDGSDPVDEHLSGGFSIDFDKKNFWSVRLQLSNEVDGWGGAWVIFESPNVCVEERLAYVYLTNVRSRSKLTHKMSYKAVILDRDGLISGTVRAYRRPAPTRLPPVFPKKPMPEKVWHFGPFASIEEAENTLQEWLLTYTDPATWRAGRGYADFEKLRPGRAA
jgi:hypothetical protein